MSMKIRRGVFETNSSSSHSLTVDPDAVRDMSLIEESLASGVMTVEINDNFGWEWARLYRPESKRAFYVIRESRYFKVFLWGVLKRTFANALCPGTKGIFFAKK